MRRALLALVALLASAPVALAERYTAVSNTAMSITGDVEMDDYGIVFANGEKLAFDDLVSYELEVDGKRIDASVYHVAVPAAPALLNGNLLCGSDKVTHVASWPGSDGLTVVAVFATPDVPVSDTQVCASFTYE